MENSSQQIKTTVVCSMILIIYVVSFLSIYLMIQQFTSAPGVVWKVPFEEYPELKELYNVFIENCKIPDIPKEYFEDSKNNETYRAMRNDCLTLSRDLDEKYTEYETSTTDLPWTLNITKFYTDTYAIKKDDVNMSCADIIDYTPRLGCYVKHISEELEQLTERNIDLLMQRLNLTNKYKRRSDCRGSTYTPPGGFMEMHSNRNHYAGWRLYMHYLPENGDSWFAYRHPYDHSYRKIKDENEKANMFRIRKPPHKLLWHGIFSDTPRFSWGIWLPPELAQYLKTHSKNI